VFKDIPPKEVLDTLLEYDETSPSCLRWKIERRKGKGSGYKSGEVGDVAGGLDGSYWRVRVCGSHFLVHRIVWVLLGNALSTTDVVDHKDGNGLNNVKTNLRCTTDKGNAQNQRQYSNNSSGVTGVYFRETEWPDGWRGEYWVATWRQDGVAKSKAFSVRKYGDAAKEMAIEYRKKMIQQLNEQGEEYTERHGEEADSRERVWEQFNAARGF
jgi:hypothetical protein